MLLIQSFNHTKSHLKIHMIKHRTRPQHRALVQNVQTSAITLHTATVKKLFPFPTSLVRTQETSKKRRSNAALAQAILTKRLPSIPSIPSIHRRGGGRNKTPHIALVSKNCWLQRGNRPLLARQSQKKSPSMEESHSVIKNA